MKYRVPILCVALTLASTVAHANAGTPLMWASVFYLFTGNAVIGAGEGVLLALVFRRRIWVCVPVMIAANYFSAFVGCVGLSCLLTDPMAVRLNGVVTGTACLVAATYTATLVLEWPFMALCLRKASGWVWKSIAAVLVIQTISYAIMFGVYYQASAASLLRELDVVELNDLQPPASACVFYISDDSGDVYALDLADGTSTRQHDLNSAHHNDRLFVRPSLNVEQKWDLVARLDSDEGRQARFVVLEPEGDWVGASSPGDSVGHASSKGTWFNFGSALRLGAADESPVEFRVGFWATEGIKVYDAEDRLAWFALETPFAMWFARNATHLPGDFLVVQLGRREICLLDFHAKKIAHLAYGRGPAVVLCEEAVATE